MSTRRAKPSPPPRTGPQQDWDIQGRADSCQVSGRAFGDGEAFWTRLVVTPEGLRREDYAEAHWTAELKAGALSAWKSVFRAPPPATEEPLKKESAEAALRKLMAEDDPGNANAIFVLAVMLERKKTLVEKDVRDRPEGGWLRVYEHRTTGEAFLIPDPALKLSELEQVQEEVAVRLGWKSAAPEETA